MKIQKLCIISLILSKLLSYRMKLLLRISIILIGYIMGIIAIAKIVTRANLYGKYQVIQPGNHKWVTLIKVY